jgi:hypothetical protein
MVECLAHGERRGSGLAQWQHAIVMRRFRQVLEENPEGPPYIAQVCKGDRGFEPNVAGLLPIWGWAKALPGAAPHGSGAARAA